MISTTREFLHEIKTVNIEELEYTNTFYEPDRKKTQQVFANNNKTSSIPIVIDYGSYATKAGWGNYENPNLVFRSVVSKNKDVKSSDGIVYVGNKFKDFDYTKTNYKTPFEKNVIQHIGILENVNDYIFSELDVNDSRVNHPVIITECFANPEFFRTKIMEQMFECYQIPSLIVGVDCLFSYYYNTLNQPDKSPECLIVSMGNNTIHVAPIVKGELQMADVKRVNIGGANCFDLTYKHLNIKYPSLKGKLTQNYVQGLIENLTLLANNYTDQLKYFRYGKSVFQNESYLNKIEYENNNILNGNLEGYLFDPILVQFPFQTEEKISHEDQKRKQDLRKEQAQRLRDTMARRKEEKLQTQKNELEELEKADDSIEQDPAKLAEVLKAFDFPARDDLKKRITKLKLKMGIISKQVLDEEKYNLINIPNDQLNPEQLKQKRYQIMQKQAAITRKLKKELETKNREETNKIKEHTPEVYLAELYERRKYLMDKIQERKKLRQELFGNRNSRASQKRMQTLAQLGNDGQKDKKGNIVDTFGMNDEDWNVYKKISKESLSDEENYESKLVDIEKELQKLDKNFEYNTRITSDDGPELFPVNDNLIEMNVDRIRGPEVFFQPSLVGVDQSGLAEIINLVVNKYSPDVRANLLQNIFITGGPAFTNNLENRLTLELQSLVSVGTKIAIKKAKDPIFDTWKGMQTFAKKKDNISKFGITKAEYDEYGAAVFKLNPFSNIYNVQR